MIRLITTSPIEFFEYNSKLKKYSESISKTIPVRILCLNFTKTKATLKRKARRTKKPAFSDKILSKEANMITPMTFEKLLLSFITISIDNTHICYRMTSPSTKRSSYIIIVKVR